MPPSEDNKLSKELLERILRKLSLANHPQADFEGLSSVYAAWCRTVPFDNVRKLIHISNNNPAPLPGGTATDFFESWLLHGTGGTCWSGNGALHALLTTLGFKSFRGVATMLVAPNLPPNHGTVMVELDGSNYLVDASILHETPLLLDRGVAANTSQSRFKLRLTERDNKWHIWWQPLHLLDGIECRIDKPYATLDEFQQRYEATRGWSPFNFQLAVRKLQDDRAMGMGAGYWVELDTHGQGIRTEISDSERRARLVDDLGFSEEIASKLPFDRQTPPPPGSETAKHAAQAPGS